MTAAELVLTHEYGSDSCTRICDVRCSDATAPRPRLHLRRPQSRRRQAAGAYQHKRAHHRVTRPCHQSRSSITAADIMPTVLLSPERPARSRKPGL